MANGQQMQGVGPLINLMPQKAPVADQVINQLQERVAQAQLQGLQEQRSGLKETKARLKQIKGQPQQKDLSALMAMGDLLAGTGGQYSQLYQHMKPQNNTREIQELEKLLTKQRQGLADDELGYLKTQFQAVQDSQKMKDLTPGQKKIDEKFAAEYVDFFAAGGYADTEKGLAQLDEAVQALESSDNITGPVVGSMPDFIKRRFSPQAAATQQAVEEVVQRNLRLILGAQFTEKEGKRLIERAYDPAASEQENAKRVKRLMGQIREAAQAKQSAAEHFEQFGSLKGYKGTQKYTSVKDFLKGDMKDKTTTSKSKYQSPAAQGLAKEFGL